MWHRVIGLCLLMLFVWPTVGVASNPDPLFAYVSAHERRTPTPGEGSATNWQPPEGARAEPSRLRFQPRKLPEITWQAPSIATYLDIGLRLSRRLNPDITLYHGFCGFSLKLLRREVCRRLATDLERLSFDAMGRPGGSARVGLALSDLQNRWDPRWQQQWPSYRAGRGAAPTVMHVGERTELLRCGPVVLTNTMNLRWKPLYPKLRYPRDREWHWATVGNASAFRVNVEGRIKVRFRSAGLRELGEPMNLVREVLAWIDVELASGSRGTWLEADLTLHVTPMESAALILGVRFIL